MSEFGVTAIERIGLNVPALDEASAFYQEALGFRQVSRARRGGAAFEALTGVQGAQASVAVMALGRQEIELVAFTPQGRDYPSPRSAADPWFQHFAIVTADMAAAYAALERQAQFTPISADGPVLLPPVTGSIVAYKFRDPYGHPLELSYFPPAVAPPAWREPPPRSIWLGVDHSAIAVEDADASLAFYTEGLGLRQAARQVNTGPAQDRLDGLADVEVDIVTLETPGGGVHMELLAYRRPKPPLKRPDARVDALDATRLVFRVTGLVALLERLQAKGARIVSQDVVSHGVVAMEDGVSAAVVRDPDGHLLELREGP